MELTYPGPDAVDQDGCVRTVVYDFGDGSPPLRIDAPEGCTDQFGYTISEPPITHDYAPGTYRVRASAISTGSAGTGVQLGALERVLVVT